ncbi:MAG: hypothetical protein RH949_20200 [Coleofasciculus sp. A1-SPW-01]|uniref:hypothetical protein n=1 Tax=Coleofasciculus sp. A1-SPW-01 TaxID=3070819 RepID=UPI0032FBB798
MTNYDQRNQWVDTQFNLNIQSPSEPDPTMLLNRGIELLEANAYQEAIKALRSAIETGHASSDAYYYLAIALLKGKRPKLLNRSEVEEIDQLLNTATVMGDSDGTVLWFRALVRDDYFNGNGITNYPPPSVNDIITTALSCNTNINRLIALLQRLPMFDNPLYALLVQELV